MAKAKAAPAESSLKERPKIKEAPPAEELENNDDSLEDETSNRREQRKAEWGTQFDRWLIRCQQHGKAVLLHIGNWNPESKGIEAIPKRIDQYYCQFEINGKEVWIQKSQIAGCGNVEE